MRIPHRSPLSPRPAFTLVELIVAMTIIAVLAGLAVMIFPRLQDSQRVAKAADTVQGALFSAKQMAMRDQQPRGIRLLIDPTDGLVHSIQYIEQPAYFVSPSNSFLIGVPNAAPGTSPNFSGIFSGVDFSGGTGGLPSSLWPVQFGDYLDLMGNNKPDGLYRIVGFTTTNSPNDTLQLLSPLPFNLLVVLNQGPPPVYGVPVAAFQNPLPYRILRGPRPMVGLQPINLPTDVVIDYPGNPKPPPPIGNPPTSGSIVVRDTQTQQVDIMFAPSGKVLRDAGNVGKVVLWVYDGDPNASAAAQEQTLVVVYTRTGVIASQPVYVGFADPYFFIRDGRSSGM
jgi:prepilin-type N-terminal cleavage/methylation domain-containing protein